VTGKRQRQATSRRGAARSRSASPLPVTESTPDFIYPSVAAVELHNLLSLTHKDPHAILGAHASPLGVIVRVFRPEAERVELVAGREKPRPMTKCHEAGFFELLVTDHFKVFPYRLIVYYPDGNAQTIRDPYAYPPTVSDMDEHLFGEGRHERVYEKLGSHVRRVGRVAGVSFAVWAPDAEGVSVVGDFNNWDGRLHQMRRLGVSGIWEIFIPDLEPGASYKYEIHLRGWLPFLKADPYAFYAEVPPRTSSIIFKSSYRFRDHAWMRKRARANHLRRPLAIYEVHLGSWRRVLEEQNRSLSYRETAPALADYILDLGFTHVEFLPLKGHPYGGSWGYQVSSYYAPTARYGDPDDFRFLVDYLHGRGIGVIMDWVPAHFPKDVWALGRFSGTALYEHEDPRRGEHPDWGTYIFNYGRAEVRNFLLANALFWIEQFHIDGLRVDAVASMLYLDYSRSAGRWIPNEFGGRENLEAVAFIKELNEVVHHHYPGAMMIAEESTSWPGVCRPVDKGGLGFDFKWNLGWMHDTLQYFSRDDLYRRFHHHNLTFGLVYAWSENFILPFSHDEVVHGKGSLINKMHGERRQRFASLRALYGYMWAHPGKKLLFMGGEIGQWREWNDDQSLDWHLLDEPEHLGLQALVRDLNRLYRQEPALWEADVEPAGFRWIDADNAAENVIAFIRAAPSTARQIVCVGNFSSGIKRGYRLGLPRPGLYIQILNTDAERYGGHSAERSESLLAESIPLHGLDHSALVDLPPMSTLWYEAPADIARVKAIEPVPKSLTSP
jgi:1,4-alpha-glucan branching enzyme